MNTFDDKEYQKGKEFKVDVDKIKTIEDVKLILGHLNLNYTPESKGDYDKLKHILKKDYICECEIGKSVMTHHSDCPHMIETFGERTEFEKKYFQLNNSVATMLKNNFSKPIPMTPGELLREWDRIRNLK